MFPSETFRLTALSQELEAKLPAVGGLFTELTQRFADDSSTRARRATYVLGTIKSGKSTLLSALLAADALPRGSGVKTFNLTRVTHAASRRVTVHFKTTAQLLALLRFDFRMLGLPLEQHADPYDSLGIEALSAHLAHFEHAAQGDGRLERLEADGDGMALLRLSLARVRQIIAGLAQVRAQCDLDTMASIRQHHVLVLPADTASLGMWADSIELAALIQEIDLELPFPKDLPPTEALVDCQGSDSLNPLDFASVDAALHRADRILYVVSSRLLLRQADRALLRHVEAAGLAGKTTIILNVEAFEPLSAQEMSSLEARLHESLAAVGASACAVVPVCALLELRRRTAHDELALIRTMWQAREAKTSLERVEGAFTSLITTFGQSGGQDSLAAQKRAEESLARRLRETARELLARDRLVHGVEALDVELTEVRASLDRILVGARTELSARLARLAHDLYDAHGPIQRLVDEFLKVGATALISAEPLPESLRSAQRHGPVMAEAMDCFNRKWIELDQTIRIQHIRPFLDQVFQLIGESVARLGRIVPGMLSQRFSSGEGVALPAPPLFDAKIREELTRYSERHDPPETLGPIALVPALAHGLATEFYARKYFDIVRTKLARQDPQKIDARKLTTLWERTLRLAYKAAAQDQEFSISSARENMKFQYMAHASERAYLVFEQAVMSGIETYYGTLSKLAAAGDILLAKDERAKLEQFLAEI